MSAQWRPARPVSQAGVCVRPIEVGDLDGVLATEAACYAFPWTRGNFIDSLAAGYAGRILCGARGELLGYFIAMGGVDEMHLLNITVAPACQGLGHASLLMDVLFDLCRDERAEQLWLEVRQTNHHAQAVYRHLGFSSVGIRKGYYPAPLGRREDAVVMSLKIEPVDVKANDALD